MREKLFQMELNRIKKRGERQKRKQALKNKYAEYYPSKKHKVSNIMLVMVVIAISSYTIANLWITYATGTSIDSTLTTCFYTFWGSELAFMTGIRVSKVVKGSDYDGSLDEAYCEDDESVG